MKTKSADVFINSNDQTCIFGLLMICLSDKIDSNWKPEDGRDIWRRVGSRRPVKNLHKNFTTEIQKPKPSTVGTLQPEFQISNKSRVLAQLELKSFHITYCVATSLST